MTEIHHDLRDRLLFEVAEAILNLPSGISSERAQKISVARRQIMEGAEPPRHSHMRLMLEVLHTARTAGLSGDGLSMALGRICDLVEPHTLTPHYEPPASDEQLSAIKRVLAEAAYDPRVTTPSQQLELFRDVIRRASAVANAETMPG